MDHMIGVHPAASLSTPREGSGSHGLPHSSFAGLEIHPDSARAVLPTSLPLDVGQEKLGPIVSLQGGLPLSSQEMHS